MSRKHKAWLRCALYVPCCASPSNNVRCHSTDDTRLAPLSFSLLICFPSGPSNLSDVVCSFVLLQCIANNTNVNLSPVSTTPVHRGNHRCGPCIAHPFVIPKYNTSEADFGSGHSDRCHISTRTPVYMFEYASRSLFILDIVSLYSVRVRSLLESCFPVKLSSDALIAI